MNNLPSTGGVAQWWNGESYTNNTTEYVTNSPTFNLTISGTQDDRAMARKVKQWLNESMDNMFDSMASKNRRIREV